MRKRGNLIPLLTGTLAGSTFADRTAKSLELVGNAPLHEAAERYPADALRVFMWRHHRTYTDESPVCNAGPAEQNLIEVCILASPDICQGIHPVCLSLCPQEARQGRSWHLQYAL